MKITPIASQYGINNKNFRKNDIVSFGDIEDPFNPDRAWFRLGKKILASDEAELRKFGEYFHNYGLMSIYQVSQVPRFFFFTNKAKTEKAFNLLDKATDKVWNKRLKCEDTIKKLSKKKLLTEKEQKELDHARRVIARLDKRTAEALKKFSFLLDD